MCNSLSEAPTGNISHVHLTQALLHVHKASACLKGGKPDTLALSSSASLRCMMMHVRTLKHKPEALRVFKTKALYIYIYTYISIYTYIYIYIGALYRCIYSALRNARSVRAKHIKSTGAVSIHFALKLYKTCIGAVPILFALKLYIKRTGAVSIPFALKLYAKCTGAVSIHFALKLYKMHWYSFNPFCTTSV